MSSAYVDAFLRPLRQCLNYKPVFGTKVGVDKDQFLALFSQDYFYNAVGLASPEVYVAHKAAGGITSFYRQLGIACENLTRSVIINELNLAVQDVKSNYTLSIGGNKDRKLTPNQDPGFSKEASSRRMAIFFLLCCWNRTAHCSGSSRSCL